MISKFYGCKGPFINYRVGASNQGGQKKWPLLGSSNFFQSLRVEGGSKMIWPYFSQAEKCFLTFLRHENDQSAKKEKRPNPCWNFGISRQRSELHFLTIFCEKRNCLLKEEDSHVGGSIFVYPSWGGQFLLVQNIWHSFMATCSPLPHLIINEWPLTWFRESGYGFILLAPLHGVNTRTGHTLGHGNKLRHGNTLWTYMTFKTEFRHKSYIDHVERLDDRKYLARLQTK